MIIGQWVNEYNRIRPHSSLGYRPPSPLIRFKIKPYELAHYGAI
ncbi:MAG: integrase core domain-containing protein [Alphaproteobacteria bacterium]|nr:integrase core domain-containing protein [Alphaproteobacteria bacterium]MBP7729580.1 integrase core domain-containing protein [Alphaproteobacteria bacterium]